MIRSKEKPRGVVGIGTQDSMPGLRTRSTLEEPMISGPFHRSTPEYLAAVGKVLNR
ncbi:hypothetical protein ACFLRC_01620 [Candidatus Altiarchaeota archaeon]